jgi:hypothetical protein
MQESSTIILFDHQFKSQPKHNVSSTISIPQLQVLVINHNTHTYHMLEKHCYFVKARNKQHCCFVKTNALSFFPDREHLQQLRNFACLTSMQKMKLQLKMKFCPRKTAGTKSVADRRPSPTFLFCTATLPNFTTNQEQTNHGMRLLHPCRSGTVRRPLHRLRPSQQRGRKRPRGS